MTDIDAMIAQAISLRPDDDEFVLENQYSEDGSDRWHAMLGNRVSSVSLGESCLPEFEGVGETPSAAVADLLVKVLRGERVPEPKRFEPPITPSAIVNGTVSGKQIALGAITGALIDANKMTTTNLIDPDISRKAWKPWADLAGKPSAGNPLPAGKIVGEPLRRKEDEHPPANAITADHITADHIAVTDDLKRVFDALKPKETPSVSKLQRLIRAIRAFNP